MNTECCNIDSLRGHPISLQTHEKCIVYVWVGGGPAPPHFIKIKQSDRERYDLQEKIHHFVGEEMQRSTVRQKDASENEGEGIENSDQASNAIWGRNVGYNEETRKTD